MEKVFILEDQRTFSTILSGLIQKRFGYEVVIASSVSDANKILLAEGDSFFVAICDLNLPDSSQGEGVDLINSYGIPVLVFTSKLDERLHEDILFKGVADYSTKEGDHNIEYVVNMVDRIYRNYDIKVMVVDDSESSSLVIEKLLRLQRYYVVRESSAEGALKRVTEEGGFRLLIIDCCLGGMNGLELTKAVRKKYSSKELSIIGVSGQVSRGKLITFMKHGADDFLLKPFVQEEFLCRVNHVINVLELTDKLENLNNRKSSIISVAAHDIRDPLSAIKIYSEFLIAKVQGSEALNWSSKIKRCAEETISLVNNMLCLSEIEENRMPLTLQLESLSNQGLDSVGNYDVHAKKKGQSFDVHTSSMPSINFDSVRIRQVIDNLISNAVKYSPKNSTIHVRTYEFENMQVFEISDSGRGIDPLYLDKLYSPYETLGSETTGGEPSTGLGLSICKNIMDVHNGDIKYSKSPYGGSRFRIYIPSV